MEWILPEPGDGDSCRELAQKLGVPSFLAGLLCRRGFSAHDAAAAFLDPKLRSLRDPFLLPGMEAAVARLLAAIDRGERIVLYGDYDVDGVASLALLSRILRLYGAAVECFLPLRVDEGYGLSAEGLARCRETCRPQLLVAVDCGTSSAAEIAQLTAVGIEVIVLDHHLPKSALPICTALVNPKLGSEEGHALCSAGIVFKVAHALLKRRPLPGCDLREYLDFVALATVADIVPLEEENRILVKRGLVQLSRTRWPGLQALIAAAGVKPPFTPSDVGFKLGPRLNAAGRLGTAQDALELLLTEDPARGRALAEALDAQNRERRQVEDEVLRAAEAQLEGHAEQFAALVAGASGWHPGVVGIVASRLMRRFHRPVIVIAFDERGVGKGSGRSIAGFSLVAALEACGGHLQKHGGHEMAAGLSLAHTNFEAFREAFREHARRTLTAAQLQPKLHLDAELPLGEIGFHLLTHHDLLQPFGMGNSQPLFLARQVTLAAEPRVLKEKHLSMHLRQGGHEHRAIWFGAAQEALPPPPWDIAYRVERNEYEGTVRPQIEIKAIRACER